MLSEGNILSAYAYCKEDISLIENYNIAINDNKRYVCHHRNGLHISREKLKEQGLYFNCPASELIFLELGEHTSLHRKYQNPPMYGKHHTNETKQKISDVHKGKRLSDEHKQKLSNVMKGENHPRYGKGYLIAGSKHPMAKQCTINGTTYGCLKDAHKALYPDMPYCTFCIKYKNNKL